MGTAGLQIGLQDTTNEILCKCLPVQILEELTDGVEQRWTQVLRRAHPVQDEGPSVVRRGVTGGLLVIDTLAPFGRAAIPHHGSTFF